MTDHHQTRALLSLHAAGGLSPEEKSAVDRHLQGCNLCRSELAGLIAIASEIRSIPMPQPSFGLAQRTRARIKAEVAAKTERKQSQKYLACMIGFAWIATVLTVVVGRFLVPDVAAWLMISPATCMRIFVAYMILSGTASIVFAGLVATHHRDERKLI